MAIENERITNRTQPETHFKVAQSNPKKSIKKGTTSSVSQGKLTNDQGVVTLENVQKTEDKASSDSSDVEMVPHIPSPTVKKRVHQEIGNFKS